MLGRTWIGLLLAFGVSCGPGPTASTPRPPHAPIDAPVPADAGADLVLASDATIDAKPCPRQCMDICCDEGEVCSHGHGPGDAVAAKCLRIR